MPAPIEDFISLYAPPRIHVALEPVFSQFESLSLLARAERLTGLSGWVQDTFNTMTPEERRNHTLVMIGFHYAVAPERSWSGLPAYLDHLATLKPEALRDKMLGAYLNIIKRERQINTADRETFLSGADAYISFLIEGFGQERVDVELETEAYTFVTDPPAMQSLIVTHLRHMWEKYLAAEWERVKPIMQDCVRAFAPVDLSGMSKWEAICFVTDQNPEACEKWEEKLEAVEHLVFVPNAHSGPYFWVYGFGKTRWITFGAHLPKGSQVYAPDLSRTEILVRLNALTDDTRLRILRHIAENGEQRSQDIMQLLNLSQSAASRHLTQLSAMGFLIERRCEGGKCYMLNPDRLEETLQAVTAFLLSQTKGHLAPHINSAVTRKL